MGDYTPVNSDQCAYTMTAAAAIVGGQLLDCTGNGAVTPSSGVLHPVGIAAHDAPSGGRVTVWILSGEVHETVIANTKTIAAGAPVIPFIGASAGTIDTGALATVAGAGLLIGICLIGGTGNAGGTVKARYIGTA